MLIKLLLLTSYKIINKFLPEVYEALITDNDLEFTFLIKFGCKVLGIEIRDPLWIPTNCCSSRRILFKRVAAAHVKSKEREQKKKIIIIMQ